MSSPSSPRTARAHADSVRRLQPRAEVRPPAAARRGARRARRRDRPLRAHRARARRRARRSTARATATRTRATSCSTCRARCCAGSRFPLGELRRTRCARSRASSVSSTADKPESQGICFVPDGDVRGALARLRPERPASRGPIVDGDGRVLGEHGGRPATRRASGAGSASRAAPGTWRGASRENRVVVGARGRARAARACGSSARAGSRAHRPRRPVRVRSATDTAGVGASRARARRRGAQLHFDEPVWAPAPGQAAVVYDAADQRVLGGGWITRSR